MRKIVYIDCESGLFMNKDINISNTWKIESNQKYKLQYRLTQLLNHVPNYVLD